MKFPFVTEAANAFVTPASDRLPEVIMYRDALNPVMEVRLVLDKFNPNDPMVREPFENVSVPVIS
jgi:hypothetical protein